MSEHARVILLAVGVTLLLQLASSALGAAGMATNLLMPFPVCYATLRRGVVPGGLVLVASTVLLTLLGGLDGGLAYLLQFGAGGFLLGLLLERRVAWDRAVFLAGTLVLLVALVSLFGYATSRQTAMTTLVSNYLDSEMGLALNMASGGDLSPDQAAEFKAAVSQVADFMRQTFFAWVAAFCYGMLLLQVALASLFQRGPEALPGVPFRQWKAPEKLIWLLIAAGFGSLFLPSPGGEIALSLLILVVPIYFLQGMAVVSHYFNRRGVPRLWRALGYLLLLVLNPMPLIVTGVGLFDLWADFRKPRLKKLS